MHRVLNNYAPEMTNESVLSSDYNWSEISIGNDTLHSDRFFGVQHPEHERNRQHNAELVFETTEHEENEENNKNIGNVIENRSNSLDSNSLASDLDEMHIDRVDPASNSNSRNANVIANVPKKPQAAKSNVPSVYYKAEFVKKKHEAQAILREREERKKREFHAKPAPNFNAIHAAQGEKLHQEIKITMPITPKVVHHHRKYVERKNEKLQQILEAQKPKPFVSHEPDVLFKEPFVPQRAKKAPTAPAPFNLQSDDRLQKRHKYDEQFKVEKQRKEREQEAKRKIEDEVIRRELRKQATFKANPNPFAH